MKKNKYSELSFADLVTEYNYHKRMMEANCFIDAKARIRSQNEMCFIKAEMIRREVGKK